MSTQTFSLPDVGEGLTEADILSWHVAPGDTVTVNQTIVEVETAKAAVELPCPFDGVVAEVLVSEGDTVTVGSPIISVTTDADDAASDADVPAPDDLATPAASDTTTKAPAGGATPSPTDDGESSGSVLVGYGTQAARTQRRRRRPAHSEPTPSEASLGPPRCHSSWRGAAAAA